MKCCTACRQEQDLSSFNKRKASADGYAARCRSCSRKDNSAYKEKCRANPTVSPSGASKGCSRCDRVLKGRDFHLNRTSMDGRSNRCKECMADIKHSLAYGITMADKNSLIDEDPYCQICRYPLRILPTPHVHTDHCHHCKEVRGILCHHCNTAIGLLRDNPDNCIAAAAYLTNHKEQHHDPSTASRELPSE